MLRIEVKGAKQLASSIRDPKLLDDILRPAFTEGAVIVEGAARSDVHVVTRKLMGSLGFYVEGFGKSLEAHVGPQPGMAQPARYTKGETSHWKTPRDGINKGDPQEYGIYEEAEHPFLAPALEQSEGQIEDAVRRSADKRLRKVRAA